MANEPKLMPCREIAFDLMADCIAHSQEGACLMCMNGMKNIPIKRIAGEHYGCDGNCDVPEFDKEDIKSLFLSYASGNEFCEGRADGTAK